MKQILITGKNSYIARKTGQHLKNYDKEGIYYSITFISVRDSAWKSESFWKYDVIIHCAAIVHRKEKRSLCEEYRKINTQLTEEIAKKAKAEGVKQFIFLSTMNVYGMETGIITNQTLPFPKSLYGKSKLEAEKVLEDMRSEKFKVCILRPPMVYGKGCRGNYRRLSEFVNIMPVFPDVDNKRSMIYIENLCHCIKQVIEEERDGTLLLQNECYVSTSEMVALIAKQHNHTIWISRKFNFILFLMPRHLRDKIFGEMIYQDGERISLISFEESIERAERR